MKKQEFSGIGFFERYLTVWVILCMVAGVLIGRFLPEIPEFLGRFEYGQVPIPIAVFGAASPVALATIVGVLVEVSVMLILVRIANRTTGWFRN